MKAPSFRSSDPLEPGFTFGNLRLESDGTLHRGSTEIHLPPKELAALRLLLTHAGQVVTPAQLKANLWADVHVTPDSISKCVSSLRARLEPEECIQTVYKRGYRLRDHVRQDDAIAAPRLPRLVIVPFATALNVPSYLGPGVAEEALAYLTNFGSSCFTVLARDSIAALVQRGFTAHQTGEALHADLVLAGTLLALPLHFRLRAEMIRVADGAQIWTEDILVRKNESPQLQSELVQRLAFRLSFGPGMSTAIRESERALLPADPETYELFLRGHQEWQAQERHCMQDGAQHLQRAAEQDSSFVAAQLDLVRACATQTIYGFLSPKAAAEQIHQITEANPYLAEEVPAVLPALGWLSFHVDRDLPAALQHFSRSATLAHDSCTTRMRVFFALSRHQFEEAEALLVQALDADPYAGWLHGELAWTQHLAGKADESLATVERALATFPNDEWVQTYGSSILAFQGKTARAVALAQELVQHKPYFDIAIAVQAYALACDGAKTEALAALERLQWLGRERFVLSSFHPAVCIALGDLQGAIAELQASEQACCPWFFQMLADPRLRPLHGHPAFEQMREGVAHLGTDTAEFSQEAPRELSLTP